MSVNSYAYLYVKEPELFPKLMIDGEDSIVFFEKEGRGVVLSGSENMQFGYIGSFNMDGFKDYHGKIELFNE